MKKTLSTLALSLFAFVGIDVYKRQPLKPHNLRLVEYGESADKVQLDH